MKILIEIEANNFVEAHQAINRLKFSGVQVLKVETEDTVFEIDETKEETRVDKLFSENFGIPKEPTIEIEPLDQGKEESYDMETMAGRR